MKFVLVFKRWEIIDQKMESQSKNSSNCAELFVTVDQSIPKNCQLFNIPVASCNMANDEWVLQTDWND